MRICNLWRNVSVLLVAGCICCAMPSCSDDDAPAVIEAAQPCASAYELNEVGDVALEFEVIPENAQVNEVKIIGENRAFEAQGFTSKGGGKWLLNARVTDFTQIKQENTVILSVRQTGGAASEVELVVTDPYTIENKFTLANPKGFNYYSADKENLYETGLPVVIAAEKQEEKKEEEKPGMDVEKKPEIKNIKVVDGAVSHKVGAVHFNIIPMTEETGFTLNVNPEKLEEVQEAIPTYSTLDFNVQLTSKNSRVASLPLTVTACAPQATVEDDALTLSRSDLGNPDFEKGFDIDVTHKLRQMGILEKSGFKVKSLGLLDENGKSVDDGPFIETQLEIMDAEGNTKCSVSLTGDARYNYAPGTYYYVLRCRQPWEYNGKTYNPSCANLKFKIVIK